MPALPFKLEYAGWMVYGKAGRWRAERTVQGRKLTIDAPTLILIKSQIGTIHTDPLKHYVEVVRLREELQGLLPVVDGIKGPTSAAIAQVEMRRRIRKALAL